ncbi:14480_t:CDS:2, partial [Funneliformis mosseae]
TSKVLISSHPVESLTDVGYDTVIKKDNCQWLLAFLIIKTIPKTSDVDVLEWISPSFGPT